MTKYPMTVATFRIDVSFWLQSQLNFPNFPFAFFSFAQPCVSRTTKTIFCSVCAAVVFPRQIFSSKTQTLKAEQFSCENGSQNYINRHVH